MNTLVNSFCRNILHSARALFGFALNLFFSNDPNKVGQLFLQGRCQFVWMREHVGRKIALRMFERRETKFFLDYLKPGHICLDVGANVGYFTNLFASKVAPEGAVIAIEPVYRNVLLIMLASAINDTKSLITVKWAAVSDSDAKVSLSQDKDSSYASINVALPSADAQIEGITLDSLIRQFDLPRVDIIKMDIEGWEYRALQGMKNILSRKAVRPKLMMIELYTDHLRRYDSSIDQICDYLGHYGYKPNVLGSKGELIPYEKKHYDTIYNVFFVDQEPRP